MFEALRKKREEKRRQQHKEALELVERAKAAEDTREVIRLYKLIVKATPDYDEAWLNMGVAYAMEQKFAKAMPLFDKCLELDPGNDQAWFFKGITYLEQGEPEQAIAMIEKSIAVGSTRPLAAYVQHGNALMDLKRFKEAAESLEVALGLERDNPDIWSLLISCYQRTGQVDKAREALDECLARFPFHNELHKLNGRQLDIEGNFEGASEEFGRLLRKEPEHPTAQMEKALADLFNADSSAALAGIEAQVRDEPNNPELLILFGSLLMSEGRVTEAIEAMEKGLHLRPDTLSLAWTTFAQITLLQHYHQIVADEKDARVYWRKALSARAHVAPDQWNELLEDHLPRLVFAGHLEEAAQVILETGHGQQQFSAAAAVVAQYLNPEKNIYETMNAQQREAVGRLLKTHAPEEYAGHFGEAETP